MTPSLPRKLDSASLAAVLGEATADASLRSLRIRNAGLTPSLVVQIADFLEANQTVTELDLSGNAIGSHGASCIATSLQHNTALRRLALANCSLKGEAVASFAEYFKTRANQTDRLGLLQLDLSNNQIDDDAAAALSDLILATAQLRVPPETEPLTMDLRKNWLSDGSMRAIAAAMQRNNALVTLRLEDNHDEEAVVARKQIAFCLQRNRESHRRSVFLNQIRAIQASMIILQDCEIEYVELSLSDAQLLCDAIHDNRSIISFRLRDNALPSEGTRRILAALSHHPCLRSLSIRDNEIRADGFAEINHLLRQSRSLRSLVLSNSMSAVMSMPPSRETLAGLHHTLGRDTTTLRSLSLANCSLGDLELSVILPAIAWARRLENLELTNSAISDRIAHIIQRVVQRCTLLERLDVRGSQLTLFGVETLCYAVREHTAIRSLLLGRFSRYSEAQVNSIIATLRESKSLTRVEFSTRERPSRCADHVNTLLTRWAARREENDRVSSLKQKREGEADAKYARYRSIVREVTVVVVKGWLSAIKGAMY